MSTLKIKCEYTELVRINQLVENPKNANKHTKEQIDRLAKILDFQGWRHPIIVSKRSGFICAGHGRLLAAKQLDQETVPVDYQDFLTDAEEYAFLVADNEIARWAELDEDKFLADLKDIDLGDIELLGLKDLPDILLDETNEGLTDEDEIPEVVEPKAKLGEIYKLGNHRLMCGDSTSESDVAKLMNGEKADMVFTDPPYGMGLDANYAKTMNVGGKSKISTTHFAKKHKDVLGDHGEFEPKLIETVLQSFLYCKEIFLWGADYYAELLTEKNNGSWIVWDKRGSESMDKGFGSAFELCWSKQKHKRDIARIVWTGFLGVKDDSKNRVHPTQKPVQLATWFFEKWGKDKNNVVDLFGGSGSTLIACEKTNRKCYMMELDQYYIDVIIARWENFTGQKAELING